MVGGEAPAVGPARGPGAGARGVGVARGIGGVETGGFGGDFGSGTEGAVGLTGGDEIGGVVFGGVGTAGAGGFGAAGDVGTDVGGFGTVGAGVAGAGGVTGLFGIAGLGAAGGGATEGVLCAEFTAGVGVFLINGDFAAVCGGLIGWPDKSAINRSLDEALDLLLPDIIAARSSGCLDETSIPKLLRSFSALCKELIKSDMASFTSDITSLRRSNESYKNRTTLVTIFSCDSIPDYLIILNYIKFKLNSIIKFFY